MRRTASYLGFRVAWFVYWNRDPAPWDAERKGVHAAFLARAAVFWALNLFWFWKLGCSDEWHLRAAPLPAVARRGGGVGIAPDELGGRPR